MKIFSNYTVTQLEKPLLVNYIPYCLSLKPFKRIQTHSINSFTPLETGDFDDKF